MENVDGSVTIIVYRIGFLASVLCICLLCIMCNASFESTFYIVGDCFLFFLGRRNKHLWNS